MKKIISILGMFLIFVIWNADKIYSQNVPPNLFSVVPQSSERLNSDDVAQRVSILKELIKPVPQSCTMEVYFAYQLNEKDYEYIVGQILEKDLTDLDEKTKPEVWGNLTYLIGKFKMKQFADAISIYLKKPEISIQAPIITTLQQLQAKELDGVIAPLLDSPEKYIRYISLETLISFRSKKAVPALIAKLSDRNSSDRYWAISKLVEINASEAAPQIAELIKDDDANIRYWALDGITKLNAKKQANEIWYLINTEQTNQTQSYAIASLIYFNDVNAVKIAAERIADPKNKDSEILKFITELKAKAIIPSLILILDKEKITDKEFGRRTDIIYCLNALDAKESSGVLRKYLRENCFARLAAIQVLGNFEAKEAVDDLLDIFYKYLPSPPNNINNDTYDSAEAAVALAKIGDPKTLKILIDVSENPKYPYRSQIIQFLNRQLNAEVWMKIQNSEVKGVDYKTIRDNAESFSSESGVPIILEFNPDINASKTKPLNNEKFPWMRAGNEIKMHQGLVNIISTIDSGTLPNTFTFIIDKGQIRILTVENAVNWWRKNILIKN